MPAALSELLSHSDGNYAVQALKPATFVDARVLAATTNETVTKPTGARFLRMRGTTPFWVNFASGTAAIPGADVTDGSSSVYNPDGEMIYVGDIATFGIIAAAISAISLEWWT